MLDVDSHTDYINIMNARRTLATNTKGKTMTTLTSERYDAKHGEYVLQILSKAGGKVEWQDYYVIKSEADFDSSIRKAEMCRGATAKPGIFRVIHRFMGTKVIHDVSFDFTVRA